MEFRIIRTSTDYLDVPPCAEAYKKPCIRMDFRTADDPAKIPFYSGRTEWWYQEGRNHRIENGQIVRDFDDEAWFVKVDTLEDLLALRDKYGHLILSKESGDPHIEIYDSYRE